MDISIIISGNLTGFSRFYASPNANDIYNEAKFDFDYRNFLTFINAGEKAYAISFSPRVIAVSLVTRILDSFRRPGVLVVTALIPRNQFISGTLNAQDKTAIYRLLNEVNDKFYEKNFLNGMVNQNPAVLMQDYYSDILSNYTFVNDRMQKSINSTIDVASPNKRIGYVATNEKDIPKYLSSLMRKSYNGYHHVFFAEKAPQNIDEPAEEIVTYKAKIENGNRYVPGEVRLTDKIPTVSPEQGERPLASTNYTYGQVLNGEAGTDIIGSIENDTIVLTFRFPREEKTIYFKFFEGTNELPIHVLRPILVESNGNSMPISTDSFTFYGKEIYGRKTIKSGNPEYTVDSSSSIVDLQRYNNGATINVYVSKGWTWTFDPMVNNRRVNIKPISITLVNKYTGEKKYIARVTGYVTERLSGSAQEWEMQIESDYYKSATFPATGPYRLEPKPQRTPSNHGDSDGVKGTNVRRNGEVTKAQGNSGQQIKLTGGENDSAKERSRIEAEKKKRLMQYGIFAIVAVIFCIGGWWGYSVWNKDKNKEGEITPDSTWVTKNVVFSLEDGSANQPEIEADNLALLNLTVASNSVKIEDGENTYSKSFTYNPENANDTILIKVAFNKNVGGEPFIFAFKRCTIDELKEGVNHVILTVKNSELTSYRELDAGNIPAFLGSQISRLSDGDKDMRAFAMHLVNLKNDIETKVKALANAEKAKNQAEKERIASEKAKAEADAEKKPQSRTGSDATGDSEIRKGLDDAGISLSKLNEITPQNNAEKDRITALRSVLGSLRNGKCPKNSKNLSIAQKQIVDQLIARNEKLNALPADNPEKQNKLKAFSDGLKAKNKGVNSIFTARTALKVKP